VKESVAKTTAEPLEAVIGRAIPSYESRPQQTAMASAVGRALAEHRHLLVEAGTGVGKSFAYLLPVIETVRERRCKVVISTYTISLQEQLIEKDIPALVKAVGIPLKAVLVKGRQNYLGLRRLMQTSRRQKTVFSNPSDLDQLHQIEDWAYETKDGSLSDLGFQPLTQLWQRVRSESNNCMGSSCATFNTCFYQRARRKVEEADILVVNHALFFADLALRRANVSILPDYEHVVFDEAHNIEAVASDHFGQTISPTQVHHLLSGIHNPQTGRGFIGMLGCESAVKASTKAHRAADAFFDELGSLASGGRGTTRLNGPPRIHDSLSPALRELAGELKALKGRFERADDQFELTSFVDRCAETAGALETMLKQSNEGQVYWLESARGGEPATRQSRRQATLRAAPLSVAEVLREELFEKVKTVVLTSATLSTGGGQGFTYLRKRLGIDKADELQLDSPFDYMNQVTLHVEAALPEPNDPTFVGAAIERAKEYLLATRGRAFVLFTSYDALNRAAALLESFCAEHDLTLLVQGQGLPRGQMIEQFRRMEGAVILGTDSFWQGVDVPGDALQTVIITKLPFAAPDQPLLAARSDAIRATGGEPFNELQVPEAVLKLKQGFGRLIRTGTDRGVVVIMDRRIKTKAYGRRFLEALPRCRVEYH